MLVFYCQRLVIKRSKFIVISSKMRYRSHLPNDSTTKRLILAPLKLKKKAAYINRLRLTKSLKAFRFMSSITKFSLVHKWKPKGTIVSNKVSYIRNVNIETGHLRIISFASIKKSKHIRVTIESNTSSYSLLLLS